VRIVAATNKNLQSLVEEGKFRQDLFYRINVVKLVLPPLRDRREDIPLLVEHFIRKFSRLSGKEILGLSPEAFPMLMSHDFPGNVRELDNIIEYATVVCRNGTIGVEHLPDFFRNLEESRLNRPPETRPSSLGEMERSYIREALKRNRWNRTATATEMGIHPTTLWRKMKRLNIETTEKTGSSSKRARPQAPPQEQPVWSF
jgi:transcriptional regulator with PAS, ATPase and Fis domain